MDKKGFIDEINPMFIGLALLGAIITVVMTKRVQGLGMFWKVLTPVATFAAIYFYLALTDG